MTPEETRTHLFTESEHPNGDWEQGVFETRFDYARKGEGFSHEQELEWCVNAHREAHDIDDPDFSDSYDIPNHNHDDGSFVPKPEVEVSLEDVVGYLKGQS